MDWKNCGRSKPDKALLEEVLVNKRFHWSRLLLTVAAATAISIVPLPSYAARQGDAKPQETVAVFGGSMTDGWLDPRNDSFVRRAFRQRSADTGTNYRYLNYAIPGYTAQRFNEIFPGKYEAILGTTKPEVVVIAWGLENDMNSRYRDSVNTFGSQVHQEIDQALSHHSVVLLVTPPVTQLLETKDRFEVNRYITELFKEGDSFHNMNVVNLDVYHQMQAYMRDHHQTYRLYYGNRWHPNEKGHELAGHILASDLNRTFGNSLIQWRSP